MMAEAGSQTATFITTHQVLPGAREYQGRLRRVIFLSSNSLARFDTSADGFMKQSPRLRVTSIGRIISIPWEQETECRQ
jgi:hypothetical protein